jgi:hypothetical protein
MCRACPPRSLFSTLELEWAPPWSCERSTSGPQKAKEVERLPPLMPTGTAVALNVEPSRAGTSSKGESELRYWSGRSTRSGVSILQMS